MAGRSCEPRVRRFRTPPLAPPPHSMVAGVACATVVAPVDLIKSRYMNQPVAASGRGAHYASMADCLAQAVRAEGPLALWKGWAPSCMRLGPHTCISLLIFERLRHWAGIAPI